MMRSQEMLHKISASLAQCHVKGELDFSLRSINSALKNLFGGKTKFHKVPIWAPIVKSLQSLFYWRVLHRRHTWILRRMTKPSKLGGAPVRTQPHIEETTSYFSKCFLLSGTNDMPFPSPLSFSLQEHQIQKPMVQPTKNPCLGFFIAYSNLNENQNICFKWGLSFLLMLLGGNPSMATNLEFGGMIIRCCVCWLAKEDVFYQNCCPLKETQKWLPTLLCHDNFIPKTPGIFHIKYVIIKHMVK